VAGAQRYKIVWVSPETHERLWALRVKMRAKSLDEVIRRLIEQYAGTHDRDSQKGRIPVAHAAK
jgi:hypothetical protein